MRDVTLAANDQMATKDPGLLQSQRTAEDRISHHRHHQSHRHRHLSRVNCEIFRGSV